MRMIPKSSLSAAAGICPALCIPHFKARFPVLAQEV